MTNNNLRYAVYKWLRAHLDDEVEMIVLSSCRPDVQLLRSVESILISHYRASGHRLLNSTDGGEGLFNPSPEARKKMSEAAKKKVGARNSRYGYTYTPEERKKLSLIQKGKTNVGVHTRWHTNRDLVDEKCSYCMELTG